MFQVIVDSDLWEDGWVFPHGISLVGLEILHRRKNGERKGQWFGECSGTDSMKIKAGKKVDAARTGCFLNEEQQTCFEVLREIRGNGIGFPETAEGNQPKVVQGFLFLVNSTMTKRNEDLIFCSTVGKREGKQVLIFRGVSSCIVGGHIFPKMKISATVAA